MTWSQVRRGSTLREAPKRAFRSLGVRNYRLFFIGHSVSVSGTWMQRVGQDWLVLRLTDDAVALGITTALQFGPMLVFAMLGGLVVDRADRRRLLLVTQSLQLVLAVALAVLTLTGSVRLWMVYLLALMLGLITVVDSPGRQAFVADLVGPDDYVNAQSLNSTAHNAGRLVGPAIAGVVIATAGVGVAFALNAASFLALLIGLTRMDVAAMAPREPVPRARGQARAGLRYVWSQPRLRAVMLLVFVIALLGQNFRVVLPVLADETYRGGAQGYGLLMALLGLGAVVGALITAARERVTGRALLVAAVVFGVANLIMAASPTLPLAAAAVVLVGFGNLTFNTLGRTLLQLSTDRSMHGRVLALHGLVFLGTTPFGGPLLGWVCETWGGRAGLIVAGISALAGSALVFPALRKATTEGTPGAEGPDGSGEPEGTAASPPGEDQHGQPERARPAGQ
jgi:MFS family permease